MNEVMLLSNFCVIISSQGLYAGWLISVERIFWYVIHSNRMFGANPIFMMNIKVGLYLAHPYLCTSLFRVKYNFSGILSIF